MNVKSAISALGLACLAASLHAQEAAWPARAITLIVPTTTGGGNDLTARLVAGGFTKSLGKPVVVKNVAGGALVIGTAEAARAAPDGYTLISAGSSILFPFVRDDIPYKLKDFQPVSQLSDTVNILVLSPPKMGATSLRDLVPLLKANPGKYNYGSNGIGGIGHLAMELLKLRTGVDASHIPYKGGSDLLIALTSGEVDLAFLNSSSGLQNMKSGQIRAIGVLANERIPDLPDVPAIREVLPQMDIISSWLGIFAPAGTPRPIVDRLSREIQSLVATREAKEAMGKFGAYATGSTPEGLAAKIAAEGKVWVEVAKKANIKFE